MDEGTHEHAEWNGWNEPDEDDTAYDELFIRWSDRWERIIRIAVIVFLAILLLTQALLQWPLFRKSVVKVEQLEGEPYKYTSDSGISP
jgi:hypothetical protein